MVIITTRHGFMQKGWKEYKIDMNDGHFLPQSRNYW